MNRIIKLLKKSRHVLLTSHVNPDGDAVASMAALGISLRRLNIKATLLNESLVPEIYRFLPEAENIVREIDAIDEYDAAVVLDCGDLGRAGKSAAVVSRVPALVNIDHHATNSMFGHYNLVDKDAAATSEILFYFIKKMGIKFDKKIATAIYTGIFTDTGSFRFSNTTSTAFAICGKMVDMGADPFEIGRNIHQSYSISRMKLLKSAIESIEILNGGRLSLMIVTRDMIKKSKANPHDTDGLINYARGIKDVKVAVLIKELENGDDKTVRHHVSLRSNGGVDVSDFASQFGGGGHFEAAGFDFDSPLSDIKSRIMEIF